MILIIQSVAYWRKANNRGSQLNWLSCGLNSVRVKSSSCVGWWNLITTIRESQAKTSNVKHIQPACKKKLMENDIPWQKLESISQEITGPFCEVNNLLPYSPWVLRAAVGGWYVKILLAIVRTYDSITSKQNVQYTHHLMVLTILQWIQHPVVCIIMLYIQTWCPDIDNVRDKCIFDCSIK